MATAYAQWLSSRDPLGKQTWRLPTEAELRWFYDQNVDQISNVSFAGDRWSTRAMQPMETGVGNLWEWTDSLFVPFQGFQAHPAYPEYSADFFCPVSHSDPSMSDTQHYVVLGGSWATHARMASRRTFRNWYQSGYPYSFIGFRLLLSSPSGVTTC
jgi:formylglycine-generating enzyme required for sulfatase activity